MDYIKISIAIAGDSSGDIGDSSGEIKDILIARLDEAGFEGFEEEASTASADGGSSLYAYIPEERFDAGILDQLLAPWRLVAQQERLPERNWNEEWEKNF